MVSRRNVALMMVVEAIMCAVMAMTYFSLCSISNTVSTPMNSNTAWRPQEFTGDGVEERIDDENEGSFETQAGTEHPRVPQEWRDPARPNCPPCPNGQETVSQSSVQKANVSQEKGLPPLADVVELFRTICFEERTDKCGGHRYQYVYAKYLRELKFRGDPFKLFEIGLGCPILPGASLQLWKRFVPNAILFLLESNRDCTEPFKTELKDRLYIGDQTDKMVLNSISTNGGFDVMIDDGGHKMEQQLISLEFLWPKLKSGGFYFVEDLHTSFMTSWGGEEKAFPSNETAVYVIQDLVNGLESGGQFMESRLAKKLFPTVLAVECVYHLCVLTKK